MVTLNDISIDKESNCLICSKKLNSPEWDAILVQLFKEWRQQKEIIAAYESQLHPVQLLCEQYVPSENNSSAVCKNCGRSKFFHLPKL